MANLVRHIDGLICSHLSCVVFICLCIKNVSVYSRIISSHFSRPMCGFYSKEPRKMRELQHIWSRPYISTSSSYTSPPPSSSSPPSSSYFSSSSSFSFSSSCTSPSSSSPSSSSSSFSSCSFCSHIPWLICRLYWYCWAIVVVGCCQLLFSLSII